MKRVIFAAVGILLFMLPASARAAQFKADPKGTVIISKSDQIKNLYVAGNTITSEADAKGDLALFGSSIIENGSVEDSLFIAGGTVTVRGTVGNNLRIAGSTVTVSGKVNGDLMILANNVFISRDTSITGDAFIYANTITIDGTVGGKTKVGASSATINGSVADLTVRAASINVNANAKIAGSFDYYSPQQAVIDSSAKLSSQPNFHKTESNQLIVIKRFLTVGYLLRLLGTLLLVWLLIRLFPKTIEGLVTQTLGNTWRSVGIGLLSLIVMPFVLIILAISLIGLPLDGLLLLIWSLTLTVGGLLGKIVFGSLIYRTFSKDKKLVINFQAALIGVVVLAILQLIPFFGPLLSFILFLIGTGGVTYRVFTFRDHQLGSV